MKKVIYMEKGEYKIEPVGKFFRVLNTDTREVEMFTMLHEAENFIVDKLGQKYMLENP